MKQSVKILKQRQSSLNEHIKHEYREAEEFIWDTYKIKEMEFLPFFYSSCGIL